MNDLNTGSSRWIAVVAAFGGEKDSLPANLCTYDDEQYYVMVPFTKKFL
jgi:hypothetical protein